MRLNNTIRKEILDAVMADAYQNEAKLCAERIQEASQIVYERLTGKSEKDMGRVPGWMFLEDSQMYVIVQGRKYMLQFPDMRAIPYGSDASWRPMNLNDYLPDNIAKAADEALLEAYSEKEKVKSKRSKLKNGLQAMLASVTTLNALKKLWPEEYAKYLPKEKAGTGLAVTTADLRDSLVEALGTGE